MIIDIACFPEFFFQQFYDGGCNLFDGLGDGRDRGGKQGKMIVVVKSDDRYLIGDFSVKFL